MEIKNDQFYFPPKKDDPKPVVVKPYLEPKPVKPYIEPKQQVQEVII